MSAEKPGPAGGAQTPAGRALALSVPAAPEQIGPLRRAAAEFAREHGAEAELAFDVALAVSEAVTNAVKYAYDHGGRGGIELRARVHDRFLEISVRDSGAGFGTGSSDGLGIGLSLIARTSAEMTVVQEGDGTLVRMRFALPGT